MNNLLNYQDNEYSELEYYKDVELASKNNISNIDIQDVVVQDDNGHIKIKNESFFIKLMTSVGAHGFSTSNALEAFSKMQQLGYKLMPKVCRECGVEVPYAEAGSLIEMAIAKTLSSFDATMDVKITTFFYKQIQAEVVQYKTEIASMKRTLESYVVEHGVPVDEVNDENAGSFMENMASRAYGEIDTPEESYLKQDVRRRQFLAFKMSMSGLPRMTQYVLYKTGTGMSIDDISTTLQIDRNECTSILNQGLGLLLQRVLRSKHLDEDEKLDILKIHGLADDDETSLSNVLQTSRFISEEETYN